MLKNVSQLRPMKIYIYLEQLVIQYIEFGKYFLKM